MSQDAGATALGPFIGDLLACSVGLPELCLEIHQNALPMTLTVPREQDVLPLPMVTTHAGQPHYQMVRVPRAVYDKVSRRAETTQIGRYVADWCACYVGLPELARGPIPQDVLPLTFQPTHFQEDMAITA